MSIKYIFDKEFIHNGQVQIGKLKCDINDLNLEKLRIKFIKDFKTIDTDGDKTTIYEDSYICKIRKSGVADNLYLIKYNQGWWGYDRWYYISDDELNLYTMPVKTSCLKIGKEASLEFSVQKEGFLFHKKTIYNYDIFATDKYDSQNFEFKIFSVLKLIFTTCEEEAISAFLNGILDALEQYKNLYIKLNKFKEDIDKEDFDNSLDNLHELLLKTYKTMYKIGKKDIKILSSREILKIKEDEKEQEKRLQEEKTQRNKKEASLAFNSFNEMIASRKALLTQFNSSGGK